MELIKLHPYFFANLPVVLILIAVIKFARPKIYSKLSLISGLICIPGAVIGLMHNGSYWNPIRLCGGTFGIEDIMFTFCTGALIWLLAAFPFRNRLVVGFDKFGWLKRSVLIGILFGLASGILWISGITGLENTLLAVFVAFIVFPLLKHKLWIMAVTGFLFFSPVYILVVKLQFMLWPEYILQWNLGVPLGMKFIGIPVGEIFFAALFGVGWPLYISYAFNVKLLKKVPVSSMVCDQDSEK